MKNGSVCFTLFVAAIGLTSDAAAQPAYEIITVPIAAQTHYIRTDFGTDPYVEGIVERMVRSIETYDSLWAGRTPTIFLDLVPEEIPAPDPVFGVIPDAEANPTHFEDLPVTIPGVSPAAPVCEVPVTDVETMPPDTIPHELAHCYQIFSTIFFLNENAYSHVHDWWAEGSAEWMMSQVESLPPNLVDQMQSNLSRGMSQSLTEQPYNGSSYFWEYFAATAGSDAAISFLIDVPADPAAHLDYLSTHLGSDVDNWFHQYARAIAVGTLPYLPSFDAIANLEEPAALPATVPLSAENFGLDVSMIIAPVEADQGLLVDVVGLREGGLKLSVLTGDGFVELAEGATIELCDTAGILTAVWSRTDTGSDSSSPAAELHLDVKEDCDAESHRVTAWRAAYTDEAGEPLVDPETGDPVGTDVAFLTYEGGLISVWPAADIIFTSTPEASFTGTLLVADPDITVASELQFVDDDTRTEVRRTTLFGTEQISYVTYTRTDRTIELWSESSRNFIETTMLDECLGRRPAEQLSFGWAAPDVLMPIRFEDDGTVLMNYRVYVGGENEEVSTREAVGRTTTTVVRRTLDIGSDSIGFRLHGTLDGRDDCEVIYESTFTPFDGDDAALLERAGEIGAEFERSP